MPPHPSPRPVLGWCLIVTVIVAAGMTACFADGTGWACDIAVPCPPDFACDGTGHCISNGPTAMCGPWIGGGTTCVEQSVEICDVAGQCRLPNYTADGGVVTDVVTGLLWQQIVPAKPCPNDRATAGALFPGVCTEPDAERYCNGLSLGGRTGGWRLPSNLELYSLIEEGPAPTIDAAAFPDTPATNFWSSTHYLDSGNAGVVDFAGGISATFNVETPWAVRCVR